MSTLNCASVDLALRSLGSILGFGHGELRNRLSRLRVDAPFDERLLDLPYEDLVWLNVAGPDGERIPPPSEVIWFHATRVPRDTPFLQTGLLPLKACLPEIQARLVNIARDLNIGHGSRHISSSYMCKMERLEEQGPCAFLLRDAALGLGKSHRNFLAVPEIVEDLAHALSAESAEKIIEAYQGIAERCIVTFRSVEPRPDAVRRALAYCHASIHGRDDPPKWNTCYAGRGHAVPPSDLIDIEWLDG